MKPEALPPKGPKPIRRPLGSKARRSLRGLLTASIAWIGSKASWPLMGPLMETIVERDNLRRALAQVRRNRGAPGVDGMTVDDLPPYLKDHWPPTPWQQAAMGTPRVDQEPAACGHLQTAAGAARRDPEGWWGHTCSRHPHGTRPPGSPRSLLRGVAAPSSRRCCRCSRRSGIRPSRRRAMAFVRADPHTKRWPGRKSISPTGTAGSSISIWRNSSIG